MDFHSNDDSGDAVPRWLETLIGEERIFGPCSNHVKAKNKKKNDRNILCLDCCTGFCPLCLSTHPPHRFLKIRKYMYCNVARLDDLEQLIDCEFIQPYRTNKAKVVYLKNRVLSNRAVRHVSECIICSRKLLETYHFCSLSCKVKHLLKVKGALSEHLYQCRVLPLPNDLQDDSDLSAGSSESDGGDDVGCSTMAGTAETEFVGEEPSSVGSSSHEAASWSRSTSRRKGVPIRAPMY